MSRPSLVAPGAVVWLMRMALGVMAGALHGLDASAEDQYLLWYVEERWPKAEAVARAEIDRAPRSVMWRGYLAAAEFRQRRWAAVVDHLRLLRAFGGRPDLNQLGMEWEALIHLELHPLAATVLDEVRQRYPTSILAGTTGAGDAAAMPSQQEQNIQALRKQMDNGLRRIAGHGGALDRLQAAMSDNRKAGALGLAMAYGGTWLAMQRITGGEPRGALEIRLAMSVIAMSLGDLDQATILLADLPPESGDWEVAVQLARLALHREDRPRAIELARQGFAKTHDLMVRARARQLLKEMSAAIPPER